MKTSIHLNGKTILVTGSLGLRGVNLVTSFFVDEEWNSNLFDSINDCYDVSLKEFTSAILRILERLLLS